MNSSKKLERVWHYTIDAEGIVWHDGTEMDDPWLLKFFMEKMTKLPNNRFQAICQGETCLIQAEDVPYVIQSVEISSQKIILKFPGEYQEELNPNSLVVGKDNV